MDSRVRRVLSMQFMWVLCAGLAAYLIWGSALRPQPSLSAATGAAIAFVNTGLIAWRMRHAAKSAGEREAHHTLKQIYRWALERYVIVAALLAAGLGGWKLMPLGLLGGFILGQAIWLAAPLMTKET